LLLAKRVFINKVYPIVLGLPDS